MNLSIVTTLYCSAPYIEEFYSKIKTEAQKIVTDFEIIFVNDGSPDNALDIAISLHKKNKNVKIIDLSRNFGHHKAIMTGLAHAKGDLVFLIDCDLEEEPSLLTKFYKTMHEKNVDVVYGVQDTRKGSWLERLTGNIFYSLFNMISSYPLPKNLITARLMSKRYVESLVEHREKEIFLAGLWAITGYEQMPLIVKKLQKTKTTYLLAKRISILVNSVTSFSNKPLLYIFYLGSLVSVISIIAVIYLVASRLLFSTFLSGWPSLIVSIWLMGGLTIFSIGLVGIYLSKIFMEVKQRPYTIIKHFYKH